MCQSSHVIRGAEGEIVARCRGLRATAMADEKPAITHEAIDVAFRPALDVLGRVPNNTASRRAADLLKTAQDYLHESRETPADNAPRRD